MLYTKIGDDGTTRGFNCNQSFSKSSKIAEALGSLDEINSFLGICKVKAGDLKIKLGAEDVVVSKIISDIQQDLFIVQAEVAGADKRIQLDRTKYLELVTDTIEKVIPPITTVIVSGGTELAAWFDFARTVSRRTERRVVDVKEEGLIKVGDDTLAYLNRLSSILYALARLANAAAGVAEENPHY